MHRIVERQENKRQRNITSADKNTWIKRRKTDLNTEATWRLWREGNPIRSLFRGVDFSRVLRYCFDDVNDHISSAQHYSPNPSSKWWLMRVEFMQLIILHAVRTSSWTSMKWQLQTFAVADLQLQNEFLLCSLYMHTKRSIYQSVSSTPMTVLIVWKRFMKTILFSRYYSVTSAIHKSTFYLLTYLLPPYREQRRKAIINQSIKYGICTTQRCWNEVLRGAYCKYRVAKRQPSF